MSLLTSQSFTGQPSWRNSLTRWMGLSRQEKLRLLSQLTTQEQRALLAEVRAQKEQALTHQVKKAKEVLPYNLWLPEVTPSFRWDWQHLELITDHLARVTDGEIEKLMIFMPPRHGKTEAVTVRYPVYRLERNPEMRCIIGAYNQTLAELFSRKARAIARERMPLSEEKAAANDWESTAGGGVRAAGVGAGVTGTGGHLIIIDDPVKSREEANSPAYRERVWNWYKDDMYTRREPGCSMILIMTRWHEDDLAGKILKSDDGPNWTVLSLPALAEDDDLLGRAPGEALCPDRYDEEELAAIAKVLGLSFFALYQQRPMPKEGDFFKRSWFEIVPAVPSTIGHLVRYWDRAATKNEGDYTAGVLMGYATSSGLAGGVYYVVDVVRGQWSDEDRNRIIKQTAALDRQRFGDVQIWEEREGGSAGKSAGVAFVKMLTGYPAYAESVSGKGAKDVRAEPFQAQAMVQAVRLVLGTWNNTYLDELASFPFGANDDQVDASSGAFRRVNVRLAKSKKDGQTDAIPAAGQARYVGNSHRGQL